MFFPDFAEIWTWREQAANRAVQPWQPVALDHEHWPPNYAAVYAWRIKALSLLRSDAAILASAKAYYADHPAEFIMHWVDTYDPRKKIDKWIPFVFFRKQYDFIEFLHELRMTDESGLCEKARDMGITWDACAYSVWSWLFIDNDAIGWGSRKQELVDKIGDVSSIFEKLRKIVERLPDIWKPEGLKPREHLTFMKMINPENGSTITGETGDNIGRGGRTAMYFKDESAHYERPELIEAALGDNTRVQVDISSVNGLGNVFHRRREAGIQWEPGVEIPTGFIRVFVMDWRDHPEKTQAWFDARKAKYDREGMQHIFAQEVERNYSAAVSNTIISYEWLEACVDAHLKLPYFAKAALLMPDIWVGGLDVADGGIDRNAFTLRKWVIWMHAEEWGERDPGTTARRALAGAQERKLDRLRLKMMYDAIGVGASVKSEYNRLFSEAVEADSKLDRGTPNVDRLPPMVAWNAGGAVIDPFEHVIPDDDTSLMNKDFFGNIKAQAWWSLRTRCYKTWNAITHNVYYNPDELMSFDSKSLGAVLPQLKKELAQAVRAPDSKTLRMIVDKTPEGMKSPNLADGGVMMYFPVPDDYGTVQSGSYGI